MPNTIIKIKNIISHLHFIVFLKGDFMYFYAVFNLYIIFLLFIYILFIIMYFRFKKGKYDIIWPINILKFCLPLISTSFFGIFIINNSIYLSKWKNIFR